MTAPLFDIEYVQPTKDLESSFYKFIYLSDPMCDGDVKVGSVTVDQGVSFTPYCLHWENVSDIAPLIRSITYFETLEDLKEYVSENIHIWWAYYGPEIDSLVDDLASSLWPQD
ncbi:MAG: hypothetical protein CML73_03080 [Rhodobiaceae bacterium]|nr:hypothetical protein [Rhodobiaceae bacterium]